MEKKECPFCGEEIAAHAQKCRFCGEWLVDVENNDATDIEDDADEDEEYPDEEEYAEPVDPQERAQIDNEIRKFRKTLFSRIADLIAKHGKESYWYQILEKYEIGIFMLIASTVGLLFSPAFLLAGLFCNEQKFGPGTWIMVTIIMPYLVGGFILAPRMKNGIDQATLNGESSMLFHGIIARIFQYILLFLPFIPIIGGWKTHWCIPILSILLYVPYIYYYIWTGREINAYKTWICNVACENYDFLHSNRFRYWNSRAAQDADLVNLRHLSGYRFIPLRCILLAPVLSVFLTIITILMGKI